jgi:hypothetical protein
VQHVNRFFLKENNLKFTIKNILLEQSRALNEFHCEKMNENELYLFEVLHNIFVISVGHYPRQAGPKRFR